MFVLCIVKSGILRKLYCELHSLANAARARNRVPKVARQLAIFMMQTHRRARHKEPETRKSLGIATAFSFSTNSSSSVSASCGLVKWCFSASQLVQLPYPEGGSEAVVVTNSGEPYIASLCRTHPSPRVVSLDPRLAAAMDRWALVVRNSTGAKGGLFTISTTALAKWQLLALTEYRAIFMVDLDVDMFLQSAGRPPADPRRVPAFRRTLVERYQSFLRSTATLVASSDWHSPINTGVMMLKPSTSTYEQGLQTLEVGTFDFRNGFNAVGPPQQAFPWLKMAQNKSLVINGSQMARRNSWNFVGSSGDQGLFVYEFLIRQGAAAFEYSGRGNFGDQANLRAPASSSWMLDHFYSGYKPWRLTMRCAKYFDFLREPAFVGVEGTQCHAILTAKASCLRPVKEMRVEACKECARLGQYATCEKNASGCRRKICDPVPRCPRWIGVHVL